MNGEIFTQAELERLQIEMLRERGNKFMPTPNELSDPELAEVLGEVTPGLLVDAIDDLLFVQRGRELGAKFTEDHFKRAITEIKTRNNLDDKTLEQAMAQQGMTMEELRQQVERSFFSQHVEQTELRVNLTEEEARQYYKQHPDEFVKPATVTVREITVSADGGADSTRPRPSSRPFDERLAKGEDFAALAKELSDSPGKTSGGLIEAVDVSVIDPAFRAEIEKLQPKQVTPPIKTGDNFILFQLQSKTMPEPLPFDAVRDQILQKIFNERMNVERLKHIEKLRTQALIEWKDDGYKQMYERALAARKTVKSSVRP